jgi:molybdopterin converting factor small subunit
MARLRLFAGLKDLAGTGLLDVDGDSVAEVVEAAEKRLGVDLRSRLDRVRIWVNGEEAGLDRPVGEGDEVALLPPVSGGSTRELPMSPEVMVPILVLVSLAAANLVDGVAWWAAAVVGVAGLWAWDVVSALEERGHDIPLVPALIAVLGSMVSVHLLGPAGFYWGPALAVVAVLGWGVASDSSRMLTILAPALVVALVAATMVGSLLLAHGVSSPPARATAAFLLGVGAAVVLGLAVERLPTVPFVDPFSVSASAAVAGVLIGAAVWELDLVGFLIVGLAMAVSLVAGRGLGSMLRTRRVQLIDLPPGMVSALDGVVLAGCVLYPMLRLVAVG